jgi:Flp pilus assembly protein TadD
LVKPVLVTVPFLLLLLDYWPLGRMDRKVKPAASPPGNAAGDSNGRGRRRPFWFFVVEKVPLLALAAAACRIAIWAEGVKEYTSRGAWWRIGTALLSYVDYLRQFFCPTGLALLYPRRGPDLPVWQVVGAGAIVLAITVAVFVWRRKCPYLLVGWLWYLGMLLPMVGLVPFGNEAPADRFTYLPQIGIAVALAWAAADWCGGLPYRRWVCGVASAVALVALTACAAQQVTYWRNSETLWRRTIACTADNYWVRNLLGNTLGMQGPSRAGEAEAEFREAIRLKPDYAEAYYGLGVAVASQGRLEQAIACYRNAIKADANNALAHNNLGFALLTCAEYDEALDHFKAAVQIKPDFAEAHYNYAMTLHTLGHLRGAMAEYEEAIKAKPDYADAYYNLGTIHAAEGRRDDAAACYRAALKINPQFPRARASLEEILSAGER